MQKGRSSGDPKENVQQGYDYARWSYKESREKGQSTGIFTKAEGEVEKEGEVEGSAATVEDGAALRRTP